MSYVADYLDMTILEEGDPADLTTVSDALDTIDDFAGAVAGDLAVVETSPSTTNHAVGEYIVYDSDLYKVTSAIAAGEILTVGTNIAATKVGTELKTLQDSVAAHEYVSPSGTVLAEAYARRVVGISAFLQRGTAFSDAPSTSEGTYVVLGCGQRITVFFIQYISQGSSIWCRDIHNGAWYNNWKKLSV